MRPCIIIPVHNRRKTTIGCLRLLRDQDVFAWAAIVVVDDGSTDGTRAAVRAEFPEAIVVEGGGDLWWGGGINLGMKWACDHGADEMIWLNDDTHPRRGALERITQVCRARRAIVTGQCHLRENGELHYGGMRKTRTGLRFQPCPEDGVMSCDTMCGNCVCIPREVVEKIGPIDVENFPHFAGDVDFGLRAKAAGFEVLIAGDAKCECSYGSAANRQSWLLGNQSLGDLWRGCFHPRNGILARGGRAFRWRHWGVMGAVWLTAAFAKLTLISVIRLLVPRSLRVKLAGRQNAAHQRMEAVREWESFKQSSAP